MSPLVSSTLSTIQMCLKTRFSTTFSVPSIILQSATLTARFKRACLQLSRTGLVRAMILTEFSALRVSRLDTITPVAQIPIFTHMAVLETCRMSLAWVSLNEAWTRLVQLISTAMAKVRLKQAGELLHLVTTTSSTNNLTSLLLLQASQTTILTHTLAPISKATRFHITAEHLSDMATSIMLPLLALRHPDNMAAMTSNSNSSKDTAKVLRPVTVKDNHLDITKEVAIKAK